MVKNKLTPLLYLSILLFIYSTYDYFEHITREDSAFEEHPWQWLLFSSAAYLSFIVFVFGFKTIIDKLLKRKHLIHELIAFTIWMLCYLSFIGPLIDYYFWPYNTLNFKLSLIPILLGISIFFVSRIIINLLLRQKIFFSI